MSAIDFGNSYLSTFGPNRDKGVRILIDAACTISDDRSGARETYYLVAPCRSENMYVDSDIFAMPDWDWRGIWSADEHVILRKYWITDPTRLPDRGWKRIRFSPTSQYGANQGVRLDIRTFGQTRSLTDYAEIADEALGARPFVARTTLRSERRGQTAVLEYPVKTMNARRSPPRFQVDTGPIIVPDFDSEAEHAIERFEVAYVVYNVLDKAEFILRRPMKVMEGSRELYTVTDYSVVREVSARNQVVVPAFA